MSLKHSPPAVDVLELQPAPALRPVLGRQSARIWGGAGVALGALACGALALGAVVACAKEARSDEAAAPASPPAAGAAAAQVVAIVADQNGFTPNAVTVSKGSNTTLRFTRTSDSTCATSVVFPELKLEKALPLNQAVDIVVPATEARTLTFQCGMAMFKSKLVIR